ncbi:Lrp/AsnC family transcriptional regulator [Pedobacter deserti]|uniref:Lrp/AsnC family transcriptional regulator n=1 Tax=Pedobacter deserti TaxID=2817382 RepID=UPI00210C5B89|nr:Lrp/AsnC family transcriptional regulator [Pedobacter sp. SYSU D00382]
MEIDKIDRMILNLLQQDAKLSNKQVAERVNKSVTPVYERIKKMEQSGLIKRYVTMLNNRHIDKTLVAFTTVQLKEHEHGMLKRFEKEIVKSSEVMECYHMTGTDDYMLKVLVKDMDEYQDFIVNRLAKLTNIGTVRSSFVMTEIKHETSFEL